MNKNTAIEYLTKYCPRDTRITTTVTKAARSGMARRIRCLIVREYDGEHYIEDISSDVGAATGNPVNDDGVLVRGCGMDMTAHLVMSLSNAVYGDGKAYRHGRI